MEARRAWVVRVLGIEVPLVAAAPEATDAPTSASALRAAEADAISKAGGGVAYAKLRLRWDGALKAAQANLAQFGQKMLGHKEAAAFKDREALEDAVRNLSQLLPDFGSTLADLLDAAHQAGADEKPGLKAKAVEAIDDYRQKLADEPELAELERTFLGPIGVYAEMEAALDELRQRLA